MLDILAALWLNDGKVAFHKGQKQWEHGPRRRPGTWRSRTVKNRLEQLRKQRGIRQEELAAALEVSRQTIGSLENGRYNPSIVLAFKIARYFGRPIEEIFIYEEDQQ